MENQGRLALLLILEAMKGNNNRQGFGGKRFLIIKIKSFLTLLSFKKITP